MPRTWIFACLLFLEFNPAQAQQDNEGSNTPPPLSLDFLEFLGDFGSVDEDSYEIIKYHAEKDLENSAPVLEVRENADEN
jgi:hypothetical protein